MIEIVEIMMFMSLKSLHTSKLERKWDAKYFFPIPRTEMHCLSQSMMLLIL